MQVTGYTTEKTFRGFILLFKGMIRDVRSQVRPGQECNINR